jgi:hypothetical protein
MGGASRCPLLHDPPFSQHTLLPGLYCYPIFRVFSLRFVQGHLDSCAEDF